MSTNLWKIDNDLRGILADIAMSGGEITPEQEEALESLQIKREDKLKGYLRAIRLYELEEAKVNTELNRMMDIREGLAKQRTKLEGILRATLPQGEPFKDEVSQLGAYWKRTEALNDEKCDIRKLPERFIRYEEKYSTKKVELKKWIEEGNEAPEGVFIEERWHLRVE